MNSKKNKKQQEPKEKSKGKAVLKSMEHKQATERGSSSKHKIIAHSGLYFPVRKPAQVQKKADLMTESNKLKEMHSSLTKTDEPQRAKIEEESILKSKGNLEISMGPSAVELCNKKSHIDENVEAKSNILHQCQGSCKCSNFIKLVDAVCSTQRSKNSDFSEIGKDAKAKHSVVRSKSVSTQQKANYIDKEESTRQTVCSELKHQNRTLSKLRPPSTLKSVCISGTQRMDAMPKSTTVSEPQPTSVPATRTKCVDIRPPSGPTSIAVSEHESVSASEPESVTVSEPLSSPEPTIKGSKVDKLPYPLEPSDKYVFMSYSSTASDIMIETQPSSDRPAFWPPSVPTYEVVYKVERLSEPTSTLPSPLKSVVQKTQLSKIAKTPPKRATSSRPSLIPIKIRQNVDTKDRKSIVAGVN